MQKSLNGIIIKVRDVGLCSNFYKNMLELGNPIIDSNFWVEFKCPNGMPLVLELAKEEDILHQNSNICWFHTIDNVQNFIKKLLNYGIYAEEVIEYKLNEKIYKFKDPEGNVFAVTEFK